MSRIAVYSVITNDYDVPKKQQIQGIDYILFTDDTNINAPGWKIVKIDKTDDCRLQRKIKILGHEALEKYEVTVYIDGNVTLKPQFKRLLQTYSVGLWTGKHPKRNCVYAEGLTVKEQDKAPENEVNQQIGRYYAENMPHGYGMFWNNVIIRDKSCREFNELWWSELEKGCHRDQISMAYTAWKLDYKVKTFVNLSYITKTEHKKKEPIKVFYSTPYRSDKNIGKANNEFVELLPDDAWVVISDADMMFLNSDFGTRIEKIINDFGDEYDLIGCLCNRIGGLHQCYDGTFSQDPDITYHHSIAQKELPHKIIDGGVAGFFMLFSKKTWVAAGGFRENTIKADTFFNQDIKRIGGKVGVYQGLYVFHQYRIHEKEHNNARYSIEHLR